MVLEVLIYWRQYFGKFINTFDALLISPKWRRQTLLARRMTLGSMCCTIRICKVRIKTAPIPACQPFLVHLVEPGINCILSSRSYIGASIFILAA